MHLNEISLKKTIDVEIELNFQIKNYIQKIIKRNLMKI